jgi:serine/threonine-protein kinase RsbW
LSPNCIAVEWLGKLPLPPENHFQVQTDLKALDRILSWFEQLKQPQIPQEIWLRCSLALAEGFTNAVRHAHKNHASDVPIDMQVKIADDTIEIRIWDYGPPFDLEDKLSKMPAQEQNHTEGGRGLQLIQQTTDCFSYTRMPDNRNCLLLVKFYGDEKGSSQRSRDDVN